MSDILHHHVRFFNTRFCRQTPAVCKNISRFLFYQSAYRACQCRFSCSVCAGNCDDFSAACGERYILQNTASISLPHSSKGQSNYGTEVSEEEMQPGDLIFYGSGSSISHVAMYIGDGKIVHASTERTGIKVSKWNYRTPIKIVSVF